MTKVEKFLVALVFPIALPIALVMYIINVVSRGKYCGGLFRAGDLEYGSSHLKERINADVVHSTPSRDRHAEVRKKTNALADADDWLGLSDWIQELDRGRETCTANVNLAEIAISALLEHLADSKTEGHDCHPDEIFFFSDPTAEKFETLAGQHTQSYPLTVIAARIRCFQGWTHRGADYAGYVSDDGWFGMAQRFEQASQLLDRFDPVMEDAPLLAAARHGLLAFMPNADRHVRQYHKDWSMLDPMNQTPHRQHALMMLPRWFGSDHDLQIAAAQAAANTYETTGEAAYFTMYRTVLDTWDPNVLSMDTARFAQGAQDFLALRNNDPADTAELIEAMAFWSAFGAARGLNKEQKQRRNAISQEMKDLARNLIRTRLTAIYAPAWTDGKAGCLAQITDAFKAELEQNQVILGNEGPVLHALDQEGTQPI